MVSILRMGKKLAYFPQHLSRAPTTKYFSCRLQYIYYKCVPLQKEQNITTMLI